jgi:hypothetical protein
METEAVAPPDTEIKKAKPKTKKKADKTAGSSDGEVKQKDD